MKKYLVSMAAIGAVLVVLGGCQGNDQQASSESTTAVSSQAEMIEVTIQITEDQEEVANKTLEIPEDNTLLSVMEDNFQIEATDGFISAIEGLKQDEAQGQYWTFTINGDWGEKGANETVLTDGDEVVFNYGKFE